MSIKQSPRNQSRTSRGRNKNIDPTNNANGNLRQLGAGPRRMTHEAIPRLANYSNVYQMTEAGSRPTIEELHESVIEDKVLINKILLLIFSMKFWIC